MPGKQVAGIVLCGLAAVCLLLGGLTKQWWSAEKDDKQWGIGLAGESRCSDSGCGSRSFERVSERAPTRVKAWVTVGRITYFATFAVVLALVLTLGMGIAGKASGGPVSASGISTILSAILLVGALAFVILFPEELSKGLKIVDGGMSYAAFLHMGGSVMGIVGSIMFMGGASIPPPNYAAMSPEQLAAAPGPSCRACSRPTRWVAEYHKHYCDGCRLYV